MWNLPGLGIEPVSPALAGGLFSTVPAGKSLCHYFLADPPLILYPLPFSHWQLFELSLWNSGKAMEVEAYALQTRNGDTERL